ncbi:MAG: nucleotidyltransferase domain-containing protein [Moorellales bacterium]
MNTVVSRYIPGNGERELLQRCRDLIREVVPDARVILYGSRARGDAGVESDYDLLILAKGPVNWRVEDAIREKLYPLELETGAVFSIAAFSEEEWNSPLYQAMPFSQNVRREGIIL